MGLAGNSSLPIRQHEKLLGLPHFETSCRRVEWPRNGWSISRRISQLRKTTTKCGRTQAHKVKNWNFTTAKSTNVYFFLHLVGIPKDNYVSWRHQEVRMVWIFWFSLFVLTTVPLFLFQFDIVIVCTKHSHKQTKNFYDRELFFGNPAFPLWNKHKHKNLKCLASRLLLSSEFQRINVIRDRRRETPGRRPRSQRR